jgi:putative DNA primase/helicase
MGNAQRFVAMHRHCVRYVKQWGWMVYDGKRWARDDRSQVMEFAKETVRQMYREAADQPDWSRGLSEWAQRSEALTRLSSMLVLAQSEEGIAAETRDFDTNPWLLNVANGTLDLQTGELCPHAAEDLITHLAPVDYQPERRSERWETFLAEVFADDADLVRFMQRAIGYSLTGETSEPAFFVAYGTGRNGKSTLMNTVRYVMGDYMQDAPEYTFVKKERSGGIPNDVAALAGARLVTVSETDSDQKLNMSLIKRVTGGDPITARFLQKEFFTFAPEFKAWMATNHKPVVEENTPAIWKRIYLIPFEQSFEGREDFGLGDKLKAEAEAILVWAVEGALAWQQHGLAAPEKVIAATQAYREEQDIMAEFFAEKCETSPDKQAQARALYQAYTDWFSRDCGLGRQLGEREFSGAMAQRGFQKRKSNGKMVYQGIAVKEPEPEHTWSQPVRSLKVVNGSSVTDDAATDEMDDGIPW